MRPEIYARHVRALGSHACAFAWSNEGRAEPWPATDPSVEFWSSEAVSPGSVRLRRLKDADVDVVLVDEHDYHTFQPLLYQVATDLLEPTVVGHPLRDLFHEQPNVSGAPSDRGEARPRRPTGAVRGDGADHLRLPRARARALASTSSASRARRSTRSRCTRCADAMRLREHVLREVGGGGRDPALIDDGALNVVDRRRRADRRRERRGAGRALPQQLREGLSGHPAGEGACSPSSKAARRSSRCSSPRLQRYAKEALEKRGVEVVLGEVVASVDADPRHAQVGHRAEGAHARVGRGSAGASRSPPRSASSCRRATAIPVGPDLSVAGHPEVFAVGDIAWITDTETNEVLPQLGSVALQSGEHAGENIARHDRRARRRSRSSTRTRGRWRRSAAARPSCSSTGDER